MFYTIVADGGDELVLVSLIGEKRGTKLFIGGEAKTGPVVVTKNGKGRALLIPINEDTDLDQASGERTPMEVLPAADNDAAWKRLARGRRK